MGKPFPSTDHIEWFKGGYLIQKKKNSKVILWKKHLKDREGWKRWLNKL